MVKRIDKSVHGKIDRLNEQDEAAVLTNINHVLSSVRSQSKESPLTDELIVSLAEAYENRRAQQVTEWERRQHVSRPN